MLVVSLGGGVMDTDVQPKQEHEEIGQESDLMELGDVRDTKGEVFGFLWDGGIGVRSG
jgi:hypothetical protein